MDGIPGDGLKPCRVARVRECSVERSKLQVFPILMIHFTLEIPSQKLSLFSSAKRFAVVGERKRNHAQAGKPASDSAKEQPVCQFAGWRRCSKNYRLITISLAQGLEPSHCMEDRSAGMTFDE